MRPSAQPPIDMRGNFPAHMFVPEVTDSAHTLLRPISGVYGLFILAIAHSKHFQNFSFICFKTNAFSLV